MIITDTHSKIKSLVIPVLKITCFILILGAVFGIGRISALSETSKTAPIEVIYPPLIKTSVPQYQDKGTAPASSPTITTPSNWLYAGSKTGKTYYPKDCSGLTRIKPENRVYFITAAEAQAAGYHITTTCKE